MDVNKSVSLKRPLNSWCLRQIHVSMVQQLGRLFHKVKFPECEVHDIHQVRNP